MGYYGFVKGTPAWYAGEISRLLGEWENIPRNRQIGEYTQKILEKFEREAVFQEAVDRYIRGHEEEQQKALYSLLDDFKTLHPQHITLARVQRDMRQFEGFPDIIAQLRHGMEVAGLEHFISELPSPCPGFSAARCRAYGRVLHTLTQTAEPQTMMRVFSWILECGGGCAVIPLHEIREVTLVLTERQGYAAEIDMVLDAVKHETEVLLREQTAE